MRGGINEVYRYAWSMASAPQTETMYYEDIISSYPDAATSWFPVGEYEILTESSVNFYVKNNIMYFKDSGEEICGPLLVRILPPKGLKVPFLMYRSHKTKRTSLPLCSICADIESVDVCNHTVRY